MQKNLSVPNLACDSRLCSGLCLQA